MDLKFSAVKQKGPGEKGAPRNFVSETGRFRVQIVLGLLCKGQSTILALFSRRILGQYPTLVAQCSATPATVAATPPCSATPFQTQISVRHLPAQGGGGCDTKIFRACSATPVLTPAKRYKIQEISCDTCSATRVARQGVPATVCN